MKSHECSSRFPAFGQKKIQNLIQMARMGKPICLDTLQLANHSHLVATLGPSFSREIGHPGCSFELITICTAPDIFLHHPTGWWFQPIWKILVKIKSFPQVGVKINKFETTTQSSNFPSTRVTQYLTRKEKKTPILGGHQQLLSSGHFTALKFNIATQIGVFFFEMYISTFKHGYFDLFWVIYVKSTSKSPNITNTSSSTLPKTNIDTQNDCNLLKILVKLDDLPK